MRTWNAFAVCCLVVVVCLAAADPAYARGGAYRGPGGSVPPGLREPSDPTPPPPPPPTSARPGAAPTIPTTPTPPPAPPPGEGDMAAPTRVRTAHSALAFSDWPFWYHHHSDMLEWPLGRRATILPTGATAPVHRRALDAILAAADPDAEEHPSVASAALIALGKAATSDEHVALLRATLEPKLGRHLTVRESAALGLGLLRRQGGGQILEPADVDGVREALFRVLESDEETARLRGFAAAALGLLGDQPSEDPDATTARLFAVLGTRPPNFDVARGVMLGLLRQPAASVTPEQREGLREIAYEGTLGGARQQQLLRCDALAVLGRKGEVEDLERMNALLQAERGVSANVTRSAAMALAFLASRLPFEDRIPALRNLLAAISGAVRDDTTRFFATILLPRVLAGFSGEETRRVLDSTLAGEVLLVRARYGHARERAWAGLALAEILSEVPWSRAADLGAFEEKARAVLRAGLQEGDPLARAGFALALGIAQDEASEEALRTAATDKVQDYRLRAYALLGLAHLGEPSPETIAVLREALGERRSELHRLLAGVALSLTGDEGFTDALAGEVRTSKSMTRKGETAAALARLRTPEATEALLTLTAAEEAFPTRAAAIAGLGRILDPGFYPSMVLLTWRLNYRASSDLINELYSIL